MSGSTELEASRLDLWQKCDKLLYPKSNSSAPPRYRAGFLLPRDAVALLEMQGRQGRQAQGDRNESLVAAKLLDDQGPPRALGPSLPCRRRASRNVRRAEQGRELGALQARVGTYVGTYTVTNALMATKESRI